MARVPAKVSAMGENASTIPRTACPRPNDGSDAVAGTPATSTSSRAPTHPPAAREGTMLLPTAANVHSPVATAGPDSAVPSPGATVATAATRQAARGQGDPATPY